MAGLGVSDVRQELAKGPPRAAIVEAPEAPNMDQE
jgi:hypothetical protein